jgi:hypothetical protein
MSFNGGFDAAVEFDANRTTNLPVPQRVRGDACNRAESQTSGHFRWATELNVMISSIPWKIRIAGYRRQRTYDPAQPAKPAQSARFDTKLTPKQ